MSTTYRFLMLAVFSGLFDLAARANVVGGDLQNFNAVPGGIDYVTVQSSETLEPGYFNVGLMLNHAVNSLPYFEDSAQNHVSYNDALTMADVGVGFGVFTDFEIGVALQRLLAQQSSDDAARGEFSGPGVTNHRIYSKYRLLQSELVGLAAVVGVVFNRVANNPLVGEGGSPVGVAELAVDTKLGGVSVAANVGYRFRRKGDPLPGMRLRPMGNQLIASLGMSYLLESLDTKLIAEIYGSRPTAGTTSGFEVRQSSSAEVLLGIKFDATSNLAVHLGGGTELIKGAATPDWRGYAGLNWSLGPVYRHDPPPDKPLQPTAKPNEERAILRNIHFATGSDQLPVAAEPELLALITQLRTSRFDKIVIEGHTDSVGRLSYNQLLSEQRARTVRQWMIDRGEIDPARIEAVGYGPTRPLADNGNYQGRQRNRRVEVLVIHDGNILERSQDMMGPPEPPGLRKP